MLDPFSQRLGTFHQQFQMLWSKAVAQLGAAFEVVADHDQPPVIDGGLADFTAWVSLELLLDFIDNLIGQGWIGGDQNRSRERVMLGLG